MLPNIVILVTLNCEKCNALLVVISHIVTLVVYNSLLCTTMFVVILYLVTLQLQCTTRATTVSYSNLAANVAELSMLSK